ncbi:MAG TPA: FG-GAP-like repeat-containing protein, partial [Silvibacterium sp.]|nr:FG-GAP-like repeat-containing protein [Silvibacterium sp.]
MQAIQNHPTFVHHTMIAGPCQAANVVGHTTAHRLFLQPVLVVFAVLLLLAASTLQGFAQTSCGQDGGQGDVVKQLPARNSKVQSPFDRVMAPYLANLKGKAKPGHTVAELPASTANAVVGGTSLNFPGFVSAPTLQLAPANGCGTLLVSVSGDFNNDGNLDIATVQADGTVKMILNPGPGGSLATAKPLTPDSSYTVNNSSILYLATADLNGDGNLDLVGQDVVHDQFVVWLGNGDGTFQNSIAYSVTPTSNASWFLGGGFFVIADFNGDGFPDIATVELEFFSGTVTEQTFLNDGKGNFTPGSESSASVGSFISAGIGQGDIVSNGSAPTGIAFAVENSSGLSILVIHSNGDGTFTSAVAPAAALVPDYYFTAKGSLYATNLTANFAGAPLIAGKSGKGPLPHNTVGSGIPTTDIVFITGDGAVYDVPYTEQGVSYDPTTINVLAGTDTQNLSAYPNPLRPSSAKMRGNDSTVSSSSDPIPYEQFLNLADMNGDGTLDLVLYSYGAIYVYLNSGTGSFTAPPAQVATGINGYSEPQPGNFDGLTYTANPSIVGVDYQFDSLSVYAGNGAGQFYAAPLVGGASTNGGGSYTALGGNITVVATGDVNGDGLQDVIAYDWTNAATATNQGYPDVVVGINNGGKPQANETANFTFTTALSAADFKNDNGSFIEPVTFASPSGGLSMLVSATGALGVMTATKGVFGAPMWIINLSYLHCPFTFADAGDVNGDGITDIVVTYPGDASCGSSGGYPSGYFTFIGASDGTYNQWYFAAFGSSLFQPRLIDIDNNGALDLVLSDQDFNNDVFGVYTVPNMSDGSGLFDLTKAAQQAQNYIVSDIIPGDYNSDGKQDLTLATEGQFNYANPSAFIQPATEGVLLLPGNGDFSFGLPTLVNSGYFAQWGSYADFNGDGAPDLALAEYGVSPDGGDEGILLATPIAQILPNLGGGNFGPAIVLNDGLFDFNDFDSPRNQVNSLTHQIYTFTGNFGNSGGNDLLISGSYATAEFINQGQSTLALTASPSSANQGQEVTLTATVTSPVNPFPATGTVSFFSGGVLIGAAP